MKSSQTKVGRRWTTRTKHTL